MRIAAALLILSGLGPTVAHAQTVSAGTFEVATLTGVNGNRQTITTETRSTVDQPFAGDVGFTAFTVGVEGTYFISPRVGVGVLVSYQRISLDVPERDAQARLAGGYYGPLVQIRLPIDARTTFTLLGSGGGIRTEVINQNTGIADNINVHGIGQYWMAGGGLGIALGPKLSFETALRYQSSAFTTPDGTAGRTTSAGLIVGLGLAVYFR